MKRVYSMTALALTGVMGLSILTPIAASASEEGKRNTAIGLGVLAAGLLLTQKNKLPGVLAAGGAAYAYSQYDRDHRRHNQDRNYDDRNYDDRDNRQNDGYRYHENYQNEGSNQGSRYHQSNYGNTGSRYHQDYSDQNYRDNNQHSHGSSQSSGSHSHGH